MGVATLAACHRLRVASPEVVEHLRWRYEEGAPGFTLAHTNDLFTGQATRDATISVRRHGCVVRGSKEPTEGQLGHCAKSTGRAQLMA
jgi:hypothetical protein